VLRDRAARRGWPAPLHGIEVYRQGHDRVLQDVALEVATAIVEHGSDNSKKQRLQADLRALPGNTVDGLIR
jgi:hypothetical protein